MMQGDMKNKEVRIHPTQKPVRLYSWILNRYAKAGDKILDTHVGSASSLIACHRAGLEYVGFEIAPHYYEKAAKRLNEEKAQISIFDLAGGVLKFISDTNLFFLPGIKSRFLKRWDNIRKGDGEDKIPTL